MIDMILMRKEQAIDLYSLYTQSLYTRLGYYLIMNDVIKMWVQSLCKPQIRYIVQTVNVQGGEHEYAKIISRT